MDPSLIFHSRNADEPTTPQPLMRVRSTGSIQLFQSTPITRKQESTLSVGCKLLGYYCFGIVLYKLFCHPKISRQQVLTLGIVYR